MLCPARGVERRLAVLLRKKLTSSSDERLTRRKSSTESSRGFSAGFHVRSLTKVPLKEDPHPDNRGPLSVPVSAEAPLRIRYNVLPGRTARPRPRVFDIFFRSCTIILQSRLDTFHRPVITAWNRCTISKSVIEYAERTSNRVGCRCC